MLIIIIYRAEGEFAKKFVSQNLKFEIDNYIYIAATSDSNFDPRFELRALVCLQNPRGYPYEIW